MIPLIAWVTVRQLVRQRRILLLVLIALLPVLVAAVFRLAGDDVQIDPQRFAVRVLADFVVNLVLPLTALLIGTSALGQDLEDGTVVYLIAKPLARWKVVAAKIGAAWAVTTLVVVACTVATGLTALLGREEATLVVAFAVAGTLGALAYSTIFVALSLRFSRALIIGLAYVFVWEAIISRFVPGVRFLSIRAYTLGVADTLTEVPHEIFNATLASDTTFVLLGIVVGLGSLYAVRLLTRYQIAERV